MVSNQRCPLYGRSPQQQEKCRVACIAFPRTRPLVGGGNIKSTMTRSQSTHIAGSYTCRLACLPAGLRFLRTTLIPRAISTNGLSNNSQVIARVMYGHCPLSPHCLRHSAAHTRLDNTLKHNFVSYLWP